MKKTSDVAELKKNINSFVKFSEELSGHVNEVVSAVGHMEQAYEGVLDAIKNLPIADDIDNVVRQGLMENILRRDMHILLSSIVRMKKTLTKSVRILIMSGNAAISSNRLDLEAFFHDQPDLERARLQLAASVELLKEMERRLYRTGD